VAWRRLCGAAASLTTSTCSWCASKDLLRASKAPAGAKIYLEVVFLGGPALSPRVFAAGCALTVLLAACAVTRQGTLTRISSRVAIPISVVITADSATIRGTNPENGESLEGILHLDREERARAPIGMPEPVAPVGGGSVSPGVGPRPATGRPAILEMTGRLEGDKGTSLRCALEVKKSLKLQGVGVCRTLEGQEEPTLYRIRF